VTLGNTGLAALCRFSTVLRCGLFADQRLHVNPIQLSRYDAAGPVGALVFSLIASRVSQRFAFRACTEASAHGLK
jgi:hypothetical protein